MSVVVGFLYMSKENSFSFLIIVMLKKLILLSRSSRVNFILGSMLLTLRLLMSTNP